MLIRTGSEPDALIAPLRQALAKIDPTLALYQAGSLTHLLAEQGNESDGVFVHVLELMAALALLLSAIGLYGIVAYAAAARKREFGIRAALGASGPQLQRALVRGGAWVTALGLFAGVGLGWLGLRLLMSTENGNFEPALVPSVALPLALVAAIAALAIWLPARRAARANPLAALRVE